MAFVYQATNKVDGKFYIGVTSRTIEHRSSAHFHKAAFGQKSKFYAAIRKHGKENFQFKSIAECKTFKSALKLEKQFISSLKPSYNLTVGGQGTIGFKFSRSMKKKLSDSKKGKPAAWLSGPNVEEIKAKLSEKAKARKGTKLFGKRLKQVREYTKLMIAARSKRVRCLTDGKEFPSANEAVKFYNLTTVHLLANSGRPSRSGLRFKYIK